MGIDSVDRFSQRAENYDKFRPHYPTGLVEFLFNHVQLQPEPVVADIAAGTGIFTEQLAIRGNPVYVVEPNAYMRAMAFQRLSELKNCTFIDGTAESTGLPDCSVDLIVSAQAFHWFDLEKTKVEFKRIGRTSHPPVAIVWNIRDTDSAFEKAYEQLISNYSDDYQEVTKQQKEPDRVYSFFSPNEPEYHTFRHVNNLTFEQLLGRTLSYSYMPSSPSPRSAEVEERLADLFEAHQQDGKVTLAYTTRLFVGRIG